MLGQVVKVNIISCIKLYDLQILRPQIADLKINGILIDGNVQMELQRSTILNCL
jgi:hypothetical protein